MNRRNPKKIQGHKIKNKRKRMKKNMKGEKKKG